jgi:fucose 4-O-acetylase-like acetyltransferase
MVVGHFADSFTQNRGICRSIYLFIYAFHMPVMLAVSGFFYKNSRNTSKVLFYIGSGFALKIAIACLNIICDGETAFSLLSDQGIPWFMFVLAIYQILMYIFRNINKVYLLAFFVILACFIGYDTSTGDYLYLSRSIIFFPFYLLGTMLSPQKTVSFLNEHYKKLLIPAFGVMVAWFFLCFYQCDMFYVLRHLFTGRNPFSELVIDDGPFARLFCYGITFLTGASLFVLVPKIQIPFFSSLGSRTLNVYFWHWIIYRLADKFLHITDLFRLGGKTGKLAFFFTAVLLSIVLSSVKIFDYPLNIIKRQCFRGGMQERKKMIFLAKDREV